MSVFKYMSDHVAKTKSFEGLLLASPLFVRFIGAILAAASIWAASSLYKNAVANEVNAKETSSIKLTLEKEIGSIKDQINRDVTDIKKDLGELAANQYTKADAQLALNTLTAKTDLLESRLRVVEEKIAKGGGPSDPWFASMEAIKNQLTAITSDINKMKSDIEIIKTK